MEDMSVIVVEQADRLFQQHVNKNILSDADEGKWAASLWAALEDAGLPLALVPEAAAGRSCSQRGGRPHPTCCLLLGTPSASETIIASRLWVDAGGDVLDGAVTLAPVNPQDRLIVAEDGSGMTLSGTAHHVPWGVQAPTALVFARDANGKGSLCRVLSAQLRPNRPRRNIAYEPRDEMHFDGVQLSASDVRPARTIWMRMG